MTPALLRAWLRPRLDLVAVGVCVVALFFLPKGVPGGIAALGVVSGSAIALQALGVVLILRATRVFNFAQVQLGAVTALLFFELIHHSQFVLFAYDACNSCFRGLPNDTTFLQANPSDFLKDLFNAGYGGWVVANFWLSAVLSFLLAPLLSWVVYMLVIRRFDNAPRLIVTVVTLALALILVAVAGAIPGLVFQDARLDTGVTPNDKVLPSWSLTIAPTIFHFGDVLLVVGAGVVVLALAAFFLFSSTGVAMRGAADNPRRALTLGISVAQLSGLSWLFAGALSGLAAILSVIQNGSSGVTSATFQVGPLVEVLAVAVIARLVSLPLVLVGAAALGVISQVFFWNYSSPVQFDAALLVITVVLLLLQQSRQSRAELEATAAYLAAREGRPIPRELRGLPVVDGWVRAFTVVVAILVVGLPFVMSPGQVSLGSVILIYTIVGLSLLVLTGWAGQISLGQFAISAVGGYVAAVIATRTGLFILADLVIGGLVGAVVAVLIGLPALRLRGLYLAVSTLAFASATSSVLLNPDALGRFAPSTLDRPTVFGFDLNNEQVFFYFSLIFLALAFLAVMGLRRSRTARALIACRDNEQAAQSFGINLLRARLEAFALSGFIAAFAGALFAYHEHGVEPAAFAPEVSVTIFNLVVIGGLGSLAGPFLGSLVYGALNLFSNPILTILGSGVGVLLILVLFPDGLSGMLYAVRDAWLRRVAIRYRIVVPSLLADVRAGSLETQAPIANKARGDGGGTFVPVRYRLLGQWDKFAQEQPKEKPVGA
ncbi:MAG TPA: ABC transporter permease [Candidatus Dormibacteraeota bacterium]